MDDWGYEGTAQELREIDKELEEVRAEMADLQEREQVILRHRAEVLRLMRHPSNVVYISRYRLRKRSVPL